MNTISERWSADEINRLFFQLGGPPIADGEWVRASPDWRTNASIGSTAFLLLDDGKAHVVRRGDVTLRVNQDSPAMQKWRETIEKFLPPEIPSVEIARMRDKDVRSSYFRKLLDHAILTGLLPEVARGSRYCSQWSLGAISILLTFRRRQDGRGA